MRLLEVEHADARLGVEAGDAEDADVGVDGLEGCHRGRAHGCQPGAVQPAADEVDLQMGVLRQGDGDWWAVGDHRRAQLVGQVGGHLERGGAGVDDHHLAGPDQGRRGTGDRLLGLGGLLSPLAEIEVGRRGRQGAAVHPLQQAGVGEVTKVSPHCVLGDGEMLAQLGGAHLAARGQQAEDLAPALGGQQPRPGVGLPHAAHLIAVAVALPVPGVPGRRRSSAPPASPRVARR